MPDDTINIYISSSFFDASYDGTDDAYIEYSVEEADNIGERVTPIDYTTNTFGDGFTNFPVEYFTTVSDSGFDSTPISYETQPITMSGIITSLFEYSLISSTSGTSYVDLNYFARVIAVSGTQNARFDLIIGDPYVYSDNILHQYWIFSSASGSLDYDTLYTAGGDYDPTDPLDYVVISGTIDSPTKFNMGTLTSGGSVRAFVDSHFSGYVYHFKPDELSYNFDSVCGLEIVKHVSDFESTVISGAVLPINYDLYSTTVVSGMINDIDVTCGSVTSMFYDFDSEVIQGSIGYQDYDAYCCTANIISGFSFDVDLLSLKISNFSLAEEEYTTASGAICVDVTDDIYNVVTSGTYFIINETVTSGVFTPITDGYRMCYNPVDNFASMLGSTTFTVHAQNDNGDVLEKDYYLVSGYMVDYDNREQNYGFNNQVVVRMSAENFASCPTTMTEAYWFTTEQRLPKDLSANIVGIPWSETNLGANISPQTETMYFYGKIIKVEIRAKDLVGNEMAPYIFEFKIEDEPD